MSKNDPAVQSCLGSKSATPQQFHVLEVVVIGDDDIGLPDQAVEIRNGDTVVRGKTDSKGWFRFEGLQGGSVDFSLFRLDGKAWEVVASLPLPEDRLKGSSDDAGWKPDRGDPPAVVSAKNVQAGRGESLSTIAIANGFAPAQVWGYGGNSSGVEEGAVHGEVLKPGQNIALPERQRREQSLAVDQRHYIHRIAVPFSLTIRLLDGVGRPRRQIPYLLRISTKSGDGEIFRSGATDLDGYLVESIAPDSVSAELSVGDDGSGSKRYSLQLAALAPVSETEGLQQRLNNLGFWCGGDKPGAFGPATRQALRLFQHRCGLPVSGKADEQTKTTLITLHQS